MFTGHALAFSTHFVCTCIPAPHNLILMMKHTTMMSRARVCQAAMYSGNETTSPRLADHHVEVAPVAIAPTS